MGLSATVWIQCKVMSLQFCREREHAHSNHQSLLGEHNDRLNKHKAR